MITCKNCKTTHESSEAICPVCQFPIEGTEKEQAVFVAKQIHQKGDVEDSFGRIKKARYILFGLAALYFILGIVGLAGINIGVNSIVILVFALFFLGCGLFSYRKPVTALLIPFAIIVFNHLLVLLYNPFEFYKGSLWKLLVVVGLGYGFYSAWKANKILKSNSYLASLFENRKK